MNGLINAVFLLVFWLRINKYCRRNPATNGKTEVVRRRGIIQGTNVQDCKYERKRNDSVMSTVIQRQADSAEESVYADVTTSDHSLRKQTEVQVCCSE